MLLLALMITPLVQAQGDYNAGLQVGIKAGADVIRALLAKDNAAYEAAAQGWNSLVKTAFSDPSPYLLPVANSTQPVQNATQGLRLGGTNAEGKTAIRPTHSFDASPAPGDINEE